MFKIISLLKKFGQFIKFGVVGILNTIISLIVYNLLLLFNMHYLIANAIGYVTGILNGYILSSKFVFKKGMNASAGGKFVLTYISSFLIGSFILYLLVDYFYISKVIAPLIVSVFNIVYNYFINKYWTFNK